MDIRDRSRTLLGFKITLMTAEEILELIADSISNSTKFVLASQNLHGVHMFFKDQIYRKLHQDERTFVRIDGMPIVWLAWLAGIRTDLSHRVPWIDLFMPLMARAARDGWRVFYLGGRSSVLADGRKVIESRYPDIILSGRDGFFDTTPGCAEARGVVEQINAFRPDVLIVGMGMGRQERWIVENFDQLDTHCVTTAGAVMEFIAGAVVTPPRWTGTFGLEWAYRLCSNPRRFTWRYLVEPWLTFGLMINYHVRRRLDAGGSGRASR